MTTNRTALEFTASPALMAHTRHAAPASLSLTRLYLMRFGYAFMVIGLALTKWPLMVNPPASRSLAQSVVDSLLVGMSVLALVGVRYPVRMLPVLLFESTWKLLWLGLVALPAARGGDMDAATNAVAVNCSLVVVILAVIPWRYVWTQYVSAPGDRWR